MVADRLARAADERGSAHVLLHPLWWLSLLVLLLNDHLLKGAGVVAPAVTGKLSDFAGMLVAPTLIAVLLRARRPQAFLACHLAVGCIFTLLELSAPAATAFCDLAGVFGLRYRVVADPTDLLALPMLALSLWLFHPQRPRGTPLGSWRRTAVAIAKVVGLSSIVATSQPAPRTPILTPAAIYVGTYDSYRVIDRRTGSIRRTVERPLRHGTVVVDHSIYETDGANVAAYAAHGPQLWQTEVEKSAYIVHADAQHVVVRHDRGGAVLHSRTGGIAWQLAAGAPLAVAADGVLVREQHALSWRSLADGRLLAKLGATSDEWIVHEGRVYTLDHGLVLEAGLDGTILRRSQVPVGMRWASQRHPLQMLLAADALEGSGPVAALDTRDLRVRWQLTHASVVALTPTIVFTHPNEYQCGSQNRPLAARAANSGRVLWHMPYCGWGTSLAADESLAVFHEARDTVTAREPQTGRAIWTVRY